MAKPIRALELHYPMIQCLKTSVMCPYRPCLHVFWIFLKTHLFVSATRIRFLNTLWFRNRVDAKSRYFLSSPVLYEYCIQDSNLVACSIFNIPSAGYKSESGYVSMRVDGQIRFEYGHVWTWKFFDPERKSCGLEKCLDTCGRGFTCHKTWEITCEWQNGKFGSNKYVSHA